MSRHVVDAPVHSLYRLFDADGRLIYVGLTHSMADRLKSHRSKWWWPQVADLSVVRFADLVEAQQAEIGAIATELPRWNIEHKVKGIAHWTRDTVQDFETALNEWHSGWGNVRVLPLSIRQHRHYGVMLRARPDLFEAVA